MNTCNNCTKFLTCNRETCKQVTYLQAGQIDRVEAKTEIKAEIKEIYKAYGEKFEIYAKRFYEAAKIFNSSGKCLDEMEEETK